MRNLNITDDKFMIQKVKSQRIKRLFDIILASLGLVFFSVLMIIIGITIKLTSSGPIIHWSKRIGINNTFFMMAKFRTMRINTPVKDIKTFDKPEIYYTSTGNFLRKYSLDELPQLLNIIKGDMSFVGPRPVLNNHLDIITLRNEKGVNNIKPGLTGLAQIKGRSQLSVTEKVKYDEYYMLNMSLPLDMKIIFMTNYYLIKENFFKK